MNIEAEVVDIASDTPRPNDTFLVDTNVWFWSAYTRASLARNPPKPYQATKYPKYLLSALRARATLLHHDLMFSELAHNIERTEAEIHISSSPASSGTSGTRPPTPKQLRRDPTLRANVFAEIETAWLQVRGMSRPLPWTISTGCASDILAELKASYLDAYDAAYTIDLRAAGITNILTDDADFGSVSGIRVFTANQYLTRQARQAGKLCQR